MKAIGIICEFNPIHNGHIYFINEIKNKYPNHLIILILNGYFLQRGELSLLSKYDKTKLSLENNVDIVLELPFIFGTHSADIFSEKSIEILNHFKIEKLIFGSESNEIKLLEKIAKFELENSDFKKNLINNLKTGISYPKAMEQTFNKKLKPNDILGVSYIKSILSNNYDIKYETIKRTNEFLDTASNESIVSATNIRCKLKNNENIEKFIPENVINHIKTVNEDLFFNLLKHSIITNNLNDIITTKEGIEHRLKKYITKATNINDFYKLIETKRYTKTYVHRLFIHILINLDITLPALEYVNILGFNKLGRSYINQIKKELTIPIKINKDSITYIYEVKASLIYDLLTNSNTYLEELKNQPIIK